MKAIKWLFFDIGYTLVNEDMAHKKRIEKLIEEQQKSGISLTYDQVYAELVKASKEYSLSPFNQAMKNMGLSFKMPYLNEYEEPYEEAEEVLKILSRGYHIGIIGNQSRGTMDRLNKYGLLKYVEICISSAEEGVAKPDPAIYKLALTRAGCEAHEAVMIGDRLDNDIYPAKKLGMKTIWIKQGFGGMQEPKSEEYKADYEINHLEGIYKILDN